MSQESAIERGVCTSTLIALSRIGRLDVLEKTAERIVIPAAVYREVVIRGHGRPGAAEVRDATWIEPRHVADRSMIAPWQTTLGAAESEAIALAKEVHAELLILDDEDARDVALSEDLPVVGLLAFLLRAAEIQRHGLQRLSGNGR
jgi:predicted nucleic acid-binding protein